MNNRTQRVHHHSLLTKVKPQLLLECMEAQKLSLFD